MRHRVRELVGRWVASLVAGLAVAGHGQWGFPWFPPEEAEEQPGPGELSWAEFEAELHALLDGARRDGVGDGSRPGGGPLA
ncbi:hypothetical protein FHR75_001175 [Kineococcus radiotolerans]|uniref:Uncharacterized protein n=2 Tax=Kineococcus radiotolerans TaxID=131568 RepID=A6W6I2_KINRD|nr:hypothetical protein [Kineococcus radiotolerans]ABS02421.1 hypothetical protein Krad_0933 [Kineococcus radiotolerans SRS30216 = ATCC BAA-149]MBB2900387.1 hypothetical protein [Kineococcus radiotolerans]